MLKRVITLALSAAVAAAGAIAFGSPASAAPDQNTYTTWNTVNPGLDKRVWQTNNGQWERRRDWHDRANHRRNGYNTYATYNDGDGAWWQPNRDRDDRWNHYHPGHHNGWRNRDRDHDRDDRPRHKR